MAIELKELVIRTSIANQTGTNEKQSEVNHEDIVADCVNQVLQQLKREEYR